MTAQDNWSPNFTRLMDNLTEKILSLLSVVSGRNGKKYLTSREVMDELIKTSGLSITPTEKEHFAVNVMQRCADLTKRKKIRRTEKKVGHGFGYYMHSSVVGEATLDVRKEIQTLVEMQADESKNAYHIISRLVNELKTEELLDLQITLVGLLEKRIHSLNMELESAKADWLAVSNLVEKRKG